MDVDVAAAAENGSDVAGNVRDLMHCSRVFSDTRSSPTFDSSARTTAIRAEGSVRSLAPKERGAC